MTEHGSIAMSPRDDIVAGSTVTLTFRYTVGSAGLAEGGSLRIATPNDAWEWPRVPLHRYFQAGHDRGGYDDGYCSYSRKNVKVELESDTDAWIDLAAEERHCTGELSGPWAHHIVAKVKEADLSEGDVITVIYGDTTWGEGGVEAQRVAPTPKDYFHAYVDTSGDRTFIELPAEELQIRVLPDEPSRFNVVLPAVVSPDEAMTMRISATDRFKNRPLTFFEGEVRLSPESPLLAMPGSVTFDAADDNHIKVRDIVAPEEGVHRVNAEMADGGTCTTSNPVWITDRDLNIYFGDLHCQSMWHSDSIGTPDENYEYARDIAGLDFMALTDAGGCYKEGWQDTQEAAQRHYEPGEFVAFKAFEYGGPQGHRNIIYRGCEIEPTLDDLPSGDAEGMFEYFSGRDDIISIPHHTKVWTDWDFYDPELEPIVEAYSCWGSGVEHNDPLWDKSEKPGSGVFNALARGYRLGFIGSGDSHAGMPGRSYPQDRQWCVMRKSGFTGVYAPELTREAIYDALAARRTYATTGV
ncbi:MAG: DUF3604 domain-containing protein, partial [Armatimonadota bacterium]